MHGELGLGFCLEGGRNYITGNRPLSVKRLFEGSLRYWFISCSSLNHHVWPHLIRPTDDGLE